ncbi:hypothetical protein [Streptomyces ossamyceticus]|nr:hypothetical protein [Streptomyces ossamyceticus]
MHDVIGHNISMINV